MVPNSRLRRTGLLAVAACTLTGWVSPKNPQSVIASEAKQSSALSDKILRNAVGADLVSACIPGGDKLRHY